MFWRCLGVFFIIISTLSLSVNIINNHIGYIILNVVAITLNSVFIIIGDN